MLLWQSSAAHTKLLEAQQNADALRLLQSFKLNDGAYYNLLGVALARNGQWDAARQFFQNL